MPDSCQAFSINGDLCSPAEASIPVTDHGLLYGDGVFEGLRFYDGEVFAFPAHLDRLFDSASALSLKIRMTRQEIETAVIECIAASGLRDGYIRLLVTRGTGPLGIDPSGCHDSRVIIIAGELAMVSEQVMESGAKLIIASTRQSRPDQLDTRIKSLNYLNHILARLEANAAGADEAVMLNHEGRISEGTADNIFVVRGTKLMTPPLHEGPLAGITREAILQVARDGGIPVLETPLSPFDLFTADECFLSGTGAELIPVREISGRTIRTVRGPVYQRIENGFRKLTGRNNKQV